MASERCGRDKGYGALRFVPLAQSLCVPASSFQKTRHSELEGRAARHGNFHLTQKRRNRIGEALSWAGFLLGASPSLLLVNGSTS